MGKMTALAVLAVGGVATAFALWPRAADETEPTRTESGMSETGATGAASQTTTQSVSDITDDARDADGADVGDDVGPPVVAPTIPARLTVLVSPWGSVWINGKPRGAAPLKNAPLKPGRYKVSAGQGSPSETRTVRLRAGQRETVRVDLTN